MARFVSSHWGSDEEHDNGGRNASRPADGSRGSRLVESTGRAWLASEKAAASSLIVAETRTI
jgi:hypothetical protein